ncbi:hypothetical protein [Thiomicrospira sp. ALE5]|uniref:hypothetical protein n=1 Tax=Thiomicrospira sp. ALE5 TaxID=748650 RepID=UPI0008E59DAF|nr:hypothetical protein [Thiomicrospira sp. ALE5]SFR51705.1 hypothetical protein SAMN03092900_0556 [Thiomicrospira sp. ALE5]
MLKIPPSNPLTTTGTQLQILGTAATKLNLPLGPLLKVEVLQVQPQTQFALAQVKINLNGQTLVAQTDLRLQPGQTLLVQGQTNHTGQILLKIQSPSPPVQLETLRQALPNQVNLQHALTQLVQIQTSLPAPVVQPLQQLLAMLRLQNQPPTSQQLAQAVNQNTTNLETQLLNGQANPNTNLKAALLRLSQALQQWQTSAPANKHTLIGTLLGQIDGAINQVKVQQIQWLEQGYNWISQHLLALEKSDYLVQLYFRNPSQTEAHHHWQVILEMHMDSTHPVDGKRHYLQLDWYAPTKLTLGIFSDLEPWRDQFMALTDQLADMLDDQGFNLARVYLLSEAPDPLKLQQDFQLIDIRI